MGDNNMNQQQEQFQQFGVILFTIIFIFSLSSCQTGYVYDLVKENNKILKDKK
jgi:hypothetical protein